MQTLSCVCNMYSEHVVKSSTYIATLSWMLAAHIACSALAVCSEVHSNTSGAIRERILFVEYERNRLEPSCTNEKTSTDPRKTATMLANNSSKGKQSHGLQLPTAAEDDTGADVSRQSYLHA